MTDMTQTVATWMPSWLSSILTPGVVHALIGLAILIIGLFVAGIITRIIKSALGKVGFLKVGDTDLVGPIGSLIGAILKIFVLMAVLQHFGLTDVLAPLKDMVNEFIGSIPNIIGFGVIAYAGWTIAKIVAELVGMALGKIDAQIAERTGNEEIQISKFGAAFIFGGILLPVAVAALGVLNIPAITEPASAMLNDLMAAVPKIVAAAIILLVAYYVSRFVVYMLTGLLEGMHINSLPEKLGIEGVFSESFTPVKLVGGTVMFFAMLTATTAAVDKLGIEIISTIFAQVLEFGGGILVGGVILLVGGFLASLAHQKLTDKGQGSLADIARIAILVLVLAMGLRAMGLADNIVNMAFGLTMGGVAVAIALSFGLGGRDAAKEVADSWAKKLK